MSQCLAPATALGCARINGAQVTVVIHYHYSDITTPKLIPVTDANGQPVLNPDGTPMMQPDVDANGQPIMETVPVLVSTTYTDAAGNPLTLAAGEVTAGPCCCTENPVSPVTCPTPVPLGVRTKWGA